MLSVNANGALVSKDSLDKHLIKKSPWLKALVAIPKVQPRYAVAVWKKYPSMKSLLKVYMNPNISEHEKEFLLKDLKLEGLMGDERNLGKVGSTRIYRVLMSTIGDVNTDEVENGPSQIHDLS
uniref:Crossover junction endonuclease EME1B n=2 Tax=Noccaea caerulescens TaxID=107243 RepID=A0A1J3CZJ9_NOCCA